MSSSFTVDPRSGVPIYLQLMEQVKRAVALGTLGAGDRLPTVKALALELTVNPNTVARAYRELERDGVIETSAGRGSFVRGISESGAPSRQALDHVVQATCGEAARELRSYGLSAVESLAAFEAALRRWYPVEEEETPA